MHMFKFYDTENTNFHALLETVHQLYLLGLFLTSLNLVFIQFFMAGVKFI